MYVVTRPNGLRQYCCGNVKLCTGKCNAQRIPAEFVEVHVLCHLDRFIGSVEDWLHEQVEARSGERRERESALERQRDKLARSGTAA